MQAIHNYLDNNNLQTPCLVMDMDIVRNKYKEMSQTYKNVKIFYAVKANPEIEIIKTLHEMGCCFDVASIGEIDRVLDLGIPAEKLSYGNTIKKENEIAQAYKKGIKLYAFDSLEELEKIARNAPNSDVFCRLLVNCNGAQWPLSRKFGCESHYAVDLMLKAKELGLNPVGISLHIGSQQTNMQTWKEAMKYVRLTLDLIKEKGISLKIINLGGGMCSQYENPILSTQEYGKIVMDMAHNIFADTDIEFFIEPGRALVADAGIIETQVILTSYKTGQIHEPVRWVYIDCGILNGLFEALGEAIRYRFDWKNKECETEPAILAGPSCDSMDIMYEKNPIQLPKNLKSGDKLRILSSGAYTTSYASIWFNGFEPIKTYIINK